VNPYEMRRTLKDKFSGAMAGRTMYVLAFSMGALDSPDGLGHIDTPTLK